MSSLDIFFVIAAAVLGVIFTAYLAWLLLLPLASISGYLSGAARLGSRSRKLAAVDRLIEEKKYREALRALRKTVVINVSGSPEVVESLKEHHHNVLSRCLIIAEELNSHPKNIADVERLLLERAELQALFLKAGESYRSLRYRREKSGKSIPSWSKTEYENRVVQINGELKRNADNLLKALDQLFSSVAESTKENIVYH